MKSDSPLMVGMVGVGGFGAYRRRVMRTTGLFRLVAAYDINSEALTACVGEEGCVPAGSFGELLDTEGLEALIICTGAKFHTEQALAAMERGLHVFVEKPLCSTAEEVRALVDMQKRTGLTVVVGHKDHSESPRSNWLKSLIDSGGLGKVATFEAVTAHGGGFDIKPGDWRGDPERNPGGMLFQCGVHSLHELSYLFGPLESVSAFLNGTIHTTETPDVAQCILRFESGLIGTLGAYHVTPYQHSLTVYGTEKALYLDDRSYGEPSSHLLQVRDGGKPEPKVPIEVPADEEAGGSMISFHQAVRHGGTPYPGLMDGAMPVLTCLAAVESAAQGRTVRMDEFLKDRYESRD